MHSIKLNDLSRIVGSAIILKKLYAENQLWFEFMNGVILNNVENPPAKPFTLEKIKSLLNTAVNKPFVSRENTLFYKILVKKDREQLVFPFCRIVDLDKGTGFNQPEEYLRHVVSTKDKVSSEIDKERPTVGMVYFRSKKKKVFFEYEEDALMFKMTM